MMPALVRLQLTLQCMHASCLRCCLHLGSILCLFVGYLDYDLPFSCDLYERSDLVSSLTDR